MKDYFAAPDATLMLLDSEPAMRAGLRDVLEAAGFLVVSTGDIGEAVDRLAEMRPDLLIVRPYINSMAGRVAADYLRTRCHGLPVLIVAGFLDDGPANVQNAVEQFYTFPVPFTGDELVAKVQEVLKGIRSKA